MKHAWTLSAACKSAVRALLAVVWLIQAGCVSVKPAPVTAPPQAPIAQRQPEEQLPALVISEIESQKQPERLYSFSIRDADVREVLMAIAKQTSTNIVVDPRVKGTVTIDLKNVTLTEALDTLTDLLGLNYAVRQNIVRVYEPVPETRIFSLQYVNVKRSGFSSATAQIGAGGTSGVGTPTTTVAPVGGGGTGGGTGFGGSPAGQTNLSTTTDTDLWKDVETGVGKLLSPVGKLVVDKQGGNILVTDFPKFLDRIGNYLEKVEGSVQRQVLIEARIVEVALTGKFQFGIDWGAIVRAGALKGMTTIPSIATGRIVGQNLAPDKGSFQIGVTSNDFSALLNVLSTQGEVNVLSSPKLTTLNNQTAVIRSATDQVFFETHSITAPPVAGGIAAPFVITDVTPRTVTIGVVLTVTPQISADGSVILHVRPTVTDSTDTAKFPAGSLKPDIEVPIVDVREADMVVRAREGQVVVIGGLIQEKRSNNESKVPLLGDLPGIGRLFRSTNQERKKTELVVLLTSTVMVGQKIDEVTAKAIDKVNQIKGASPW